MILCYGCDEAIPQNTGRYSHNGSGKNERRSETTASKTPERGNIT